MDFILWGTVLLGMAFSFAISVGLFFFISFLKKKMMMKELKNEAILESSVSNLLMSLSTGDFLNKLLEFMHAFLKGELAMTIERLKHYVEIRRDFLRKAFKANLLDIANQERLLGEGLKAISIFIMSNFVEKSPRRKRLKKMRPRFESVAIKLERAMLNPKAFFNGGGATELSYEEVRELLTTVLASAGANKALRMEAQKLLDELWKNWQKYLELGARKAQLDDEVKLWKNFAEENSDIIIEVLGKYTFCYEGWPEIG